MPCININNNEKITNSIKNHTTFCEDALMPPACYYTVIAAELALLLANSRLQIYYYIMII